MTERPDVVDPTTCEHPDSEVRSKTCSNGVVQYGRQCLRCGRRVGKQCLPHAEVGPGPFTAFDEDLRSRVWEVWWKSTAKERETKRQEQSLHWWAEYGAYMASAEWAAKRDAVFARAAGVCEGCGISPPAYVHHLSYAHKGDEFLWELVAVCKDCHRKAHPDRDL